MYALFEKGRTPFFEEKLPNYSLPTIVLAIVGKEVLCAAFFQESAFSLSNYANIV